MIQQCLFYLAICKYLQLLEVPNGIKALGFSRSDIPKLVKGALPQVFSTSSYFLGFFLEILPFSFIINQQRVLKISPIPVGEKELTQILEDSLENY